MTPALRFALITFAGLVLVQSAWILAVPPFRGIDEFDHVFRAAGVADGQWRPNEPVVDGRGVIVEVPAGLVEAASPQCDSLPYTGPDNCYPIEERPGDKVTIATAAGLYSPPYYVVVGWPTRWLDGASADYALRAVSALICAVGVAAAAWGLAVAGAGPWTRLGFLVSVTPVLVYTTILPAPNSIEIVAALCLWTSLLALVRRGASDRTGAVLLALATISGCLVGSMRTIGPLWLGLVVLTVIAFAGIAPVVRTVRSRATAFTGATAAVAAAVAAGAWWTLSAGIAGAVPASETGDSASEASTWVSRAIVWTVQIVGAFPFRDQPAPAAVYALYFAVVVPFLAVALLVARGRRRAVLVTAIVATVALPLLLTVLTSASQGVIWQGRYTLPYVVGILILGGTVLDARGLRLTRRVLLPAATMISIAHAWSVWDVAVDESRRTTTYLGPDWVTLPPFVLGGMVLLAWLVLLREVGPGEAPPVVAEPAAETHGAGAR